MTSSLCESKYVCDPGFPLEAEELTQVQKPVVTVSELSIHSSEGCIVEDLSLELFLGQPITILGETGSGKSLLAQAIMGALPAGLTHQGKVTLFEQPNLSSKEIESMWGRKIGMLPQEPWLSLDPIMAGERQLSLVEILVNKESKEAAKSKVAQKLASFGLGSDGKKVPSQLSGGMAQRLAYLCATAAGGEILIADEPTKGLDASRKQQIIELLQQHSVKGALLTITHDIDVARALGGEIIVMRQGHILERGRCERVLNAPKTVYAEQLIASQKAMTIPEKVSRQQGAIVSARQLTAKRGGRTLFRELNFSIAQGEIVGVVGDSGTGKSTLADMLLGLAPAFQGDIVRCDSLTIGKALKLYQDPPSAFPQSVTLAKNLDDLCKLHHLNRDLIEGLMARLGLSKALLLRRPSQVSGGELQRFAILRALLMKPKLLIADEPTSRLDPIVGASTMQLLIEQTQAINCALLLISHDRDLVDQVCDKVIDIADFVA